MLADKKWDSMACVEIIRVGGGRAGMSLSGGGGGGGGGSGMSIIACSDRLDE